MKLREYLERLAPGSELTCWDKDVDSEFYFYSKDEDWEPDEDFPNVEACSDKLADMLDVVKIHEHGVEVNLYDLLDHPKIIEYAKECLYGEHQYEDDDDIVMLLFDDNVTNISQGFEEFSGDMIKCLDTAYGSVGLDAVLSNAQDRSGAANDYSSKEQDYTMN